MNPQKLKKYRRPRICVPIIARTTDEIVSQAEKVKDCAAEIIEWRCDYFEDYLDLEQVLSVLQILKNKLHNKELLFTFRTLAEGGQVDIGLKDYENLCLNVAKSGLVDLIDIELNLAEFLGRHFLKKLKKRHTMVILSHHNFEKTLADPEMIFKVGLMYQLGADIGKLAMMPKDINDVLRVMGIIQKAHNFYNLPLAVMAMGDLGKVSRLSGELTGSVFTFGAYGETSAPGQLPVDLLAQVIDALQIHHETD